MRVLVTGGTGFVGSHTVAALRAAGHEVRLLVRRASRIAPALAPLGITEPVDHVVGDITDRDSVVRAVKGCDAVIHAAAVFSFDSRADRETNRTNVAGTHRVLRTAVDHGCDPVIHVSSTVALLQRGATVTADSPVSSVNGTYIRSKTASDQVARDMQAEGAPVTIVYPGAVYGPHDPHLSDTMGRLRDILRGFYPMWPTGGVHAVDVRDVADLHAALITPGQGARRYIVPGVYLDGPALFGTLRELTGRRLGYLPTPSGMMLPLAWIASMTQRVLPFHLPAEYEGVLVLHQRTRCDDTATRKDLGIEPRPLHQTLRDAVRWLAESGHLSRRHAGLLG